jgi:hypothetical protein
MLAEIHCRVIACLLIDGMEWRMESSFFLASSSRKRRKETRTSWLASWLASLSHNGESNQKWRAACSETRQSAWCCVLPLPPVVFAFTRSVVVLFFSCSHCFSLCNNNDLALAFLNFIIHATVVLINAFPLLPFDLKANKEREKIVYPPTKTRSSCSFYYFFNHEINNSSATAVAMRR